MINVKQGFFYSTHATMVIRSFRKNNGPTLTYTISKEHSNITNIANKNSQKMYYVKLKGLFPGFIPRPDTRAKRLRQLIACNYSA